MLAKVTDVTKGELENQYNGLGFRVASTRPEEKIEYLCDLSRGYYNLLERTVNGETESFIYDNNVVSMSKSGNNYYYLQDELGSPMYMTGTDGVAVSSYAFDDFGRNIDPFTGKKEKPAYTKQGNIMQPLAFTGYQHDEMTDSYFAQARYYDSNAGRFISRDKARFILKGVPYTHNIYTYCGNNSMMNIDPDGHESIVVSGGSASSDDFQYQFIETAIKDMRDQISSGMAPEDITWVVMNAGYCTSNENDIINFTDTAKQLGVNIIIANGSVDLINYINDKSGEQSRSDDLITQMSFYCHGRTPRRIASLTENELSFGYHANNVNPADFSFRQSDIARLDAAAFDNAVTYFYSCNAGTDSNSGLSFAQTWSNKTGGQSLALRNARSLYAFINSTGNYGFYTGFVGGQAFAPADVYNYFLSKFNYNTSEWVEKKRRHDRNTNEKGYSEYGSLNYPCMVSLAGDLDGIGDIFDRGWQWFYSDCED